jgi:hypothetical protein
MRSSAGMLATYCCDLTMTRRSVFVLHGRIAGLDEDLFAVLAQAAPAAANVAAPGPPLEDGIRRPSSLSEREVQRERHQRGFDYHFAVGLRLVA